MSEQTTATTEPQAPAPSKFQAALAALSAKQATAPAAEAEPSAPSTPEAPKEDPLSEAREEQKYLAYQRKLVEEKKARKALEDKLNDYKVFESKDPKAIANYLAKSGLTLDQLAKGVLDEPPEEPAPEDPEVKALKEKVEALERKEQEAIQKQAYEENLKVVSETIKAEAEKYPAISSFPRAPAEILRRAYAYHEEHGEAPNLDSLLREFNDAVYTDVDSILASDHALKAYLSRPETKSRVLSLLGIKQSAGPASDEGRTSRGNHPSTAISTTAAVNGGARTARPQTREEKIAAALGTLKRKS